MACLVCTLLTSCGVPAKAIILGTAVGYVAVLNSFFFPNTVFLFLVNSSGAVALLVYLMIAVSELRMSRILEREDPERLKVKMWLFPYLTYLTILCILGVVVIMAFTPDLRIQLLLTLLSLVIVLVAYVACNHLGSHAESKLIGPQSSWRENGEPSRTRITAPGAY